MLYIGDFKGALTVGNMRITQSIYSAAVKIYPELETVISSETSGISALLRGVK